MIPKRYFVSDEVFWKYMHTNAGSIELFFNKATSQRFSCTKENWRRKRGRLLRGWGCVIVGKLVTNYWKAQEWKINGGWRWARVGPDYGRVYISEVKGEEVWEAGWFGEWNIIGASFHADSTEARRPHLAGCMDSVRPGSAAYWTVGYVRTHTYVLRSSL